MTKSSSSYNWLQFNGDPQHSGSNIQETQINRSTVSGLKRAFQVSLPGIADGAPIYLSGVSFASGTHDLVFVTTKDGYILALDARSGATVWSHQNPPGTCGVYKSSSNPCYTTSSPAIDPNLKYVYSYGLDGYVHKYQVQDGVEIKSGGWPELATLKGYFEKGSSALAVATGKNGQNYLYVANSGYLGDQGDYQGHVTVINLQDGSQKVFNTLCSNNPQHFAEAPTTPNCPDVQSAIWARPGVIYDPDTDRIYMATGNGNYDPAKFDWGDSVFAINPDGSGANGRPLDSYTPANYPDLQATDTDLGSTAPAILQVPTNSKVKHLALQSGKDAIIRLINLDNLSGQGGPGHTGGEVWSGNVPQGGAVFSQPAAWVNPADGSTWTFITTGSGISGLKLAIDSTGNPSLQPVWIQQLSGTSPLVLKDVLFIASGSGITALDPLTGNTLWSDPQVAHFHWESPIVANGYLYISDEDSHLTGYTTAP